MLSKSDITRASYKDKNQPDSRQAAGEGAPASSWFAPDPDPAEAEAHGSPRHPHHAPHRHPAAHHAAEPSAVPWAAAAAAAAGKGGPRPLYALTGQGGGHKVLSAAASSRAYPASPTVRNPALL